MHIIILDWRRYASHKPLINNPNFQGLLFEYNHFVVIYSLGLSFPHLLKAAVGWKRISQSLCGKSHVTVNEPIVADRIYRSCGKHFHGNSERRQSEA